MKKNWLFIIVLLAFTACEEDNSPGIPEDNFDRQAMLAGWADQIIIPAYTALANQTESLKLATEGFEENPNASQFAEVQEAYWQTYITWQKVSMFEIGKASELQLRDFVNIYPADQEGILANINSGNYNLELPSQRDKQGFAALDYLLYGTADNETEMLAFYTTDDGAEAKRNYLFTIVNRIDELVDVVLASWVSGYRDEFVNNNGNSATASVDRLVNDYLFYYERSLRAGKVGIPAGVFSGTPLPSHVESLYRGEGSKELLLTAINASNDFFIGKTYSSDNQVTSLKDYLDYLNASKEGQALSTLINAQFDAARTQAALLNDNLGLQIAEDNTLMLRTYDELQKNVILLKVDMLQALNVNVDYVDADGD